MVKLEQLIDLVIELLRALCVEVLSEHVRKLTETFPLRNRPRGMAAIRRHVHRRCRRRLLNRISTGRNDRRPG